MIGQIDDQGLATSITERNGNMSMKRAKVGLIAVSGVRIYNDRLRRFGVTLPGFFERANDRLYAVTGITYAGCGDAGRLLGDLPGVPGFRPRLSCDYRF